MKNLIMLLILLGALETSLFAQPTQQWVQRYDGPNQRNDIGYKVSADDSGNVYVLGTTVPTSSQADIILIKYNSAGVQQWLKVYGWSDSTNEVPASMIIDNSGNICIVVGASGGQDIGTLKYNAAGTFLWSKKILNFNPGSASPSSIAVDNSNNIYVSGRIQTISNPNNDAIIIKYNPATGDTVWSKRINGSANGQDGAQQIIIDNSNNIYVSGSMNIGGSIQDAFTAKYSSSGTLLWLQIYNSSYNLADALVYVDLDNAGNFYACGLSYSPAGDADWITVKYNNSGVFQWDRRYNGTQNAADVCSDIEIDSEGNVFVTGYIQRIGSPPFDALTIKYNSNGDSLWVAPYGSGGSQIPRRLLLDNSGIYVCTPDLGSGTDYAIIKYSYSGAQLWVQHYNNITNGEDNPLDIALDNSGNLYITGSSQSNLTSNGYDIATLKYSQLTGVTPVLTEMPTVYSLRQNYPNPFNPETIIGFTITSHTTVKLNVYDALGRKIETLVNDVLNAGVYEVKFNALKYSTGVYYYRLEAGDFSGTRKMILIK